MVAQELVGCCSNPDQTAWKTNVLGDEAVICSMASGQSINFAVHVENKNARIFRSLMTPRSHDLSALRAEILKMLDITDRQVFWKFEALANCHSIVEAGMNLIDNINSSPCFHKIK